MTCDNEMQYPYFILMISNNEKYNREKGFLISEENKIITYNCFNEAKTKLKKLEDKIVPNIITSFTLEFSKICEDIEFELIKKETFGQTSDNRILYDLEVSTTMSVTKIAHIQYDELSRAIKSTIKNFNVLDSKVSSLLHSGFKEKDRFKKFLNLFQALEIYTQKTFSNLDFYTYVENEMRYPEKMEKSAQKFIVERMKDSRNLAQRFNWCAIIKWRSLTDLDIDDFMEIKKMRDRIAHGDSIDDSELLVERLAALIIKILR